MTWEKKTKYYLQNGNHTICKVKLNRVMTYELWEGAKVIKQGFKSSDEAIKYHETNILKS